MLSSAAVKEVFARFKRLNPEPKCELNYSSDYTLLVAIVLSAQTTDKNVNKAKSIIALSKDLVEKFGGKIPADFDTLQTLAGVGRKTANVFLNTFYGLPTFGVDTHVLRLSNRIGIAAGKTPIEVEKNLEKAVKGVVPDDDLKYVGHWLVLHGRYVCAAKKPACDICPIADLCEKNF